MWRSLRAAGFTNVALNTQPGLNHVSYSAKEMELNAAFLLSLFPSLSINGTPGRRADAALKAGWFRWLLSLCASLCLTLSLSVSHCVSRCISGWFRWLLGLVDVRWLAVALWNYMRSTLARTLPRRRQAQRPGAVASGSAVPSTPPVATAALTAEGTDWAKAAAADMARRNAPPSAPPSAPPAAPFRLAKGANTTG